MNLNEEDSTESDIMEKATRHRAPAKPSSPAHLVTLRTAEDGDICQIATGKKLQELAMRWSYIVRQRHRWAQQQSSCDEMEENAVAAFHELGVSEGHLEKLAAARVNEVSLSHLLVGDDETWEARVFPWEFMLSAATRTQKSATRAVVVRHISVDPNRPPQPLAPGCLVIVETAPGRFQDAYDFEGEKQLVRSILHGLSDVPLPPNPTESQLRAALAKAQSPVIHITGIDTHLGAALLGEEDRKLRDGLYLSKNERGGEQDVNPEQLAGILNSGKATPVLVGFNVWDSGARMVPQAVANGVGAAIGFEHNIDDSVAEMFFANFYRTWMDEGFDLLKGFESGLAAISRYGDQVRGTGIVLCSSQSLVQKSTRAALPVAPPQVTLRVADPKQDRIEDLVQVEVDPIEMLNYSSLHNRRSLLNKLTLSFVGQSAVCGVQGVEVFVKLNVGSDSFPYNTRVNLSREVPNIALANTALQANPRHHLAGGIHVPLTSELARSVDESIQTSLLIEITWHDQVLYRHTHPVRLAPVDEWRFNDEDIAWLPSFVQPRDPAVQTIIASAQRYLMCLADDTSVGFDGYQSFNARAAKDDDKWSGVDRQVQAIWSALVLDHRLHYINPPPSYSENAQRLRMPSQILHEGRGTCVDLALLLASCLEWIEIYPVIFNLDDHAFPGYWRSLEYYEYFRNVRISGGDNTTMPGMGERRGTPGTTVPPWYSEHTVYEELKKHVAAGYLVPLESTLLTAPAGFADAMNAGREYFSQPRNRKFHSMVDIVHARAQRVTPLPLCEDAIRNPHRREVSP